MNHFKLFLYLIFQLICFLFGENCISENYCLNCRSFINWGCIVFCMLFVTRTQSQADAWLSQVGLHFDVKIVMGMFWNDFLNRSGVIRRNGLPSESVQPSPGHKKVVHLSQFRLQNMIILTSLSLLVNSFVAFLSM